MALYFQQMQVSDETYYEAEALLNYMLEQNTSAPDYMIDPETGRIIYFLSTPNNTTVYAFMGLTYSDHESITEQLAITKTQQYMNTYNASYVSGPNPSYNCHSYAWHNASTSNMYWIDGPFAYAYMTDGSYIEVTTPAVGDKVTYKKGTELIAKTGKKEGKKCC